MLSSTQNDRPMVDMARSPRMTFMSVTGVTPRFCWNLCQFAPSSSETNMPNSVPAKSSPSLSGSSRTTRVGKSSGMPFRPSVSSCHRRRNPRSCICRVSSRRTGNAERRCRLSPHRAATAPPHLRGHRAARPRGVTFCQLLPLSCVTYTGPSLEPDQMTPA